MNVIPVIDVQHGTAVRAERGRRADYRPLVTPLAEGSDPVTVARGLMSLSPFPVLYVADLDGIEGRGANGALIAKLGAALAGAGLWVDDGTPVLQVAARLEAGSDGALTPVVGTEILGGAADLAALRALPADRYVLSLDFKDGSFAGPPQVLAEPEHWPQRVIVMTLARVGSGEGPDIPRLEQVLKSAHGRSVYAAGGVRHAQDLAALAEIGCAGALIASALHSGAITAGDLNEIAGR